MQRLLISGNERRVEVTDIFNTVWFTSNLLAVLFNRFGFVCVVIATVAALTFALRHCLGHGSNWFRRTATFSDYV